MKELIKEIISELESQLDYLEGIEKKRCELLLRLLNNELLRKNRGVGKTEKQIRSRKQAYLRLYYQKNKAKINENNKRLAKKVREESKLYKQSKEI